MENYIDINKATTAVLQPKKKKKGNIYKALTS